MAVWQFHIQFVPRYRILERFGQIPMRLNDEELAVNDLESGVRLPSNYEISLKPFGRKETLKWAADALNWGDYDKGTHITIYDVSTPIANVFARFDVAHLDERLILSVLEFARLCDCVLIANEDVVFEPDFEEFVEQMKRSNAYLFVRNPKEFLLSPEVERMNEKLKRELLDEQQSPNS